MVLLSKVLGVTILSAMGLPGGGVISVGNTHALVRAGDVPEPTALLLGPRATRNRLELNAAERDAYAEAGVDLDVNAQVKAGLERPREGSRHHRASERNAAQ